MRKKGKYEWNGTKIWEIFRFPYFLRMIESSVLKTQERIHMIGCIVIVELECSAAGALGSYPSYVE